MTATTHPTAAKYSFSNDDPEAADRHDHLSELLDGFTQDQLARTGDLTGRRCLEIGAGGGSIARWLAEQVGPAGRVLATDLNPRHIPEGERYEIIQHDVTTDPVPEGPWDLIHARLVLVHLPQRAEIVRTLAAALAPGGVLAVEDWATEYPRVVLAAPDKEAAELVEAFQTTLLTKILPSNGNDPTWARRTYGAMVEAGLVEVETTVHCKSWPGGTAGALMIIANLAQCRDQFLAEGYTEAKLNRLCEIARDPRLVVRGHFTFCTIGRRPGPVS